MHARTHTRKDMCIVTWCLLACGCEWRLGGCLCAARGYPCLYICDRACVYVYVRACTRGPTHTCRSQRNDNKPLALTEALSGDLFCCCFLLFSKGKDKAGRAGLYGYHDLL